MTGMQGRKGTPALCWDCANATGGCFWSNSLEPVEGWTVEESNKDPKTGEYKSILVLECPEFIRDAYGNGMKRIKGKLLEDYFKE